MQNFITILVAVMGSTGLATLITFLINRHDAKNDKIEHIRDVVIDIKKDLEKNERDQVRTQLLLLMTDFPEEQAEILRCAEHYFSDLDGNWYMTSLFMNWLKLNDLPCPNWFDSKN